MAKKILFDNHSHKRKDYGKKNYLIIIVFIFNHHMYAIPMYSNVKKALNRIDFFSLILSSMRPFRPPYFRLTRSHSNGRG